MLLAFFFFLLVLARSSNSALAFLEPYQKRSCQKHWTNSTFEHWSFLQSEGVQSYTRAIFRVSNFLHFDTAIPPPPRSYSSIILYFLGLQTHQVNQTLNNNDFVIAPPTNHSDESKANFLDFEPFELWSNLTFGTFLILSTEHRMNPC